LKRLSIANFDGENTPTPHESGTSSEKYLLNCSASGLFGPGEAIFGSQAARAEASVDVTAELD
jgi:hypothetical protein